MIEPKVDYEARDAVAWITLNRPQARNALTFAMYDRLAEICRETKLGGEVKCLVVTGAGPRKVDEPVEVRSPLETRPRTDGHQHLFDEALGGRGRRLVAIGDHGSVVRVDRHRDHRGAERQHDVIRWSDPPRATPGASQFSIAEILLSRSASGKKDEAPPLADQGRPS